MPFKKIAGKTMCALFALHASTTISLAHRPLKPAPSGRRVGSASGPATAKDFVFMSDFVNPEYWRRLAAKSRFMSDFVNDPEYWRKLAAKRRALAGPVKDEKSKQLMLEIAEDFDRLAKRVEATRSTQ